MDSLDKVQSLYKSGRYQCDLFFYTKLYEIANHLNLYEYLPAIKNNKQIVQKTSELTKKHLKALEQEDDEQKALQIIKQINKHVSEIDTLCIKQIFTIIQEMKAESYQNKVIAYVKAQPFKKLYSEIFDRLYNNLHDPVLRLQDLFLMSIFMYKNGDKIANFVKIYAVVLEHGVNQLKKFRPNYDFIANNPEVEQHQKVKVYLKGSQIIIQCLLKFNQIYKLLSGDSRFGIKLNAYRKDIEISRKNHHSEQVHKEHPYKEFKHFLVTHEPLPNICSLCLCVGEDHYQCLNTIKLLYGKND